MVTFAVRPRVDTSEAWQYTSDTPWPSWITNTVIFTQGELFLCRRSGRQLIQPNEWLVQNLDGEPEWYTNEDFHDKFEVVG